VGRQDQPNATTPAESRADHWAPSHALSGALALASRYSGAGQPTSPQTYGWSRPVTPSRPHKPPPDPTPDPSSSHRDAARPMPHRRPGNGPCCGSGSQWSPPNTSAPSARSPKAAARRTYVRTEPDTDHLPVEHLPPPRGEPPPIASVPRANVRHRPDKSPNNSSKPSCGTTAGNSPRIGPLQRRTSHHDAHSLRVPRARPAAVGVAAAAAITVPWLCAASTTGCSARSGGRRPARPVPAPPSTRSTAARSGATRAARNRRDRTAHPGAARRRA